MTNLNYSIDAADECVRLLNTLIYEYNRICSDTDNSLRIAVGSWQGDSAKAFGERGEDLISQMRLTALDLSRLQNSISGNSDKYRTLENKIFSFR